MELLPTLQTVVGMLYCGASTRQRRPRAGHETVPEGFRFLTQHQSKLFMWGELARSQNRIRYHAHSRFLVEQSWSDIPNRLREFIHTKTLPVRINKDDTMLGRNITLNLIEIHRPIELHQAKSYILHLQRVDIEQAVAIVIRLLPEYRADLVPLVPTIVMQSCMWLEDELEVKDLERCRRGHLRFLMSLAKVDESGSSSWEELALLLTRVRRKGSRNDLSRALRLPDWLRKYVPTHPQQEQSFQYPVKPIENPIIVSKKNYNRLTRYVGRLVPMRPEKVLRRDIEMLSRQLVYGEEVREAISKTEDRKALAYTFMALQRKLQTKVVSDLHCRFLQKGESRKFQQNTPDIPTNFENKLAEIAMADEKVDWAVLKGVRPPRETERIELSEELYALVDRICECFERYVWIHGRGHTEPLRPLQGRWGGFRGPVDDWNAAVDVLVELRRRIHDAQFGIVTADEMQEDMDGFTFVEGLETKTSAALEIPKADKFLALDIMSWNKSWGDDVFAVEKMPPRWWTWLQNRRAEGVVPKPDFEIVID